MFCEVRRHGVLRSSLGPSRNTIRPIDALPWGLLILLPLPKIQTNFICARVYSYIEYIKRAYYTRTRTILLRLARRQIGSVFAGEEMSCKKSSARSGRGARLS